MSTDRELLKIVRESMEHTGSPIIGAMAALAELEARADERERLGFEWPQKVYDAALSVLGDAVANRNGRTRKGLDRKIAHALRTWDDNYGPLNPEQAEYAASCLASCFQPQWVLPQMYRRLDLVVHNDTVHQGFIRRSGIGPIELESVGA